jgi:hypothetical protein
MSMGSLMRHCKRSLSRVQPSTSVFPNTTAPVASRRRPLLASEMVFQSSLVGDCEELGEDGAVGDAAAEGVAGAGIWAFSMFAASIDEASMKPKKRTLRALCIEGSFWLRGLRLSQLYRQLDCSR